MLSVLRGVFMSACQSGESSYDERSYIDVDILARVHDFAKLGANNMMLSGLSQSEYLVLSVLYRHRCENPANVPNAVNVSKIAHFYNVSSPAVSRTLKALEDRGLISRDVDKANRRNTFVTMTKPGEEIYKQNSTVLFNYFHSVTEKFGREKLDTLLDLLSEFCTLINSEATLKQFK